MKPDPDHLIEQAVHLAERAPRRPRETDLRRGVSAAYYALFHTLCSDHADLLAGGTPAWTLAYRAVQHGEAKDRCKEVRQRAGTPAGIRAFAHAFVVLQEERHSADYDPARSYKKTEVLRLVEIARQARTAFLAAERDARRSFVAEMAFRRRR